MSEQTDHDLLIVIANDSKWIKDWALNHEKQDAANAIEVRNIAKAAHARIDKLFIGGILALIILSITVFFK